LKSALQAAAGLAMLRLLSVISVTLSSGNSSAELSRRTRSLAALMGVGLLGALAVASVLSPDPRGRGTHEQLGLPPCTLTVVAGLPCPACGMTTSWSLVTHGRLADAARTHASGTLLALVALVVGLIAVIVAVQGKRLAWQPGETTLALGGVALALLVVAEWIFRLAAR